MNLVRLDVREPLEEFVDGCAEVQVLEKRGYRQSRPGKTPSASHFGWVPIDGNTKRPVHAQILIHSGKNPVEPAMTLH